MDKVNRTQQDSMVQKKKKEKMVVPERTFESSHHLKTAHNDAKLFLF
jgi:hypothetical protein